MPGSGSKTFQQYMTTRLPSVTCHSTGKLMPETDGTLAVMYCWNVFDPLPGMTGEYKFAVVTILHYAGNGQWSYEEDVYNEKEAEAVLASFLEDAAAAGATGV